MSIIDDSKINAEEVIEMLDQAIDHGISIFDEDQNYLYLNAAGLDNYGIGHDEFVVGDNLQKMHRLMREKAS